MDEIKKMFQVLVNGQSAMKAELLTEIEKLRKEMNEKFDKVYEEFKGVDNDFEKVNKRLDRLGMQLAELDSDAPTGEEFQQLKAEVEKIKLQIAST